MSDNKKNDILEEQRRAREEFLKLKKMQKGEMDAGPKPSEIAIVPKTPKEKWDNFWFQYKWVVIASVSLFIVLSVLIAQCATKKNPDLEIVYFTYTPALDSQMEPVADYFEEMIEDINGDGEKIVQIINCSVPEKSDPQYRNTMLSKLQAMIAADEKAMLFITDSKSVKYFDNFSSEVHIFEDEPSVLSDEFYKATETAEYGSLPEGLQISIRRISDTLLEDNEKVSVYHKESQKVMEKVKQ